MIELLLNAENALALGLLDSAEQTYRSVLAADPRNGIAAVGLSRVALERGDEAGALALAQAALEIDPENATARRMIDRLEEVARYRDADPSAAAATTAPGAPDETRATTVRAGPAVPARPAAPADPPAPASPAGPPATPAPASAAAPSPSPTLPARPGLLRRIFRRS